MESHEAIRLAVGKNALAIAKRIGRSANLVQRWTLPNNDFSDSGAYSDLDRLVSLMDESLRLGTPVSEALAPIYHQAHHFGGVFLPPVPHTCDLKNISQHLVRLARESGEAIASIGKAIEDDRLTPTERKDALKELHDLLHEVSATIRVLEEK